MSCFCFLLNVYLPVYIFYLCIDFECLVVSLSSYFVLDVCVCVCVCESG